MMAFTVWSNRIIGSSKVFHCTSIFPRWLNTQESSIPIANYAEIKAFTKDHKSTKNKLLIDVREPKEIEETGQIPHSINIPLGMVKEALSPNMKEEQFEKKFGKKKPICDTEIICYCKIGVRSLKAAEEVRKLGYQNVKNYKGSWTEWEAKEMSQK